MDKIALFDFFLEWYLLSQSSDLCFVLINSDPWPSHTLSLIFHACIRNECQEFSLIAYI